MSGSTELPSALHCSSLQRPPGQPPLGYSLFCNSHLPSQPAESFLFGSPFFPWLRVKINLPPHQPQDVVMSLGSQNHQVSSPQFFFCLFFVFPPLSSDCRAFHHFSWTLGLADSFCWPFHLPSCPQRSLMILPHWTTILWFPKSCPLATVSSQTSPRACGHLSSHRLTLARVSTNTNNVHTGFLCQPEGSMGRASAQKQGTAEPTTSGHLLSSHACPHLGRASREGKQSSRRLPSAPH